MAVAPLVAGWTRFKSGPRPGPWPAPSRGSSRPGVPFLQQQLGQEVRLIVEVAWAADPTADADTWTWTDITTDVRQDPGVSMRIGVSDEAADAQPSTCSMRLDNQDGKYSLGGQSVNWPNVRRNVPLRVQVDLGTGPQTRFIGYVTAWPPVWDVSGTDAYVNVTANGVLRRLQQGESPLVSAYRRDMTSNDYVVGYWPCEDGDGSTRFASAFTNGQSLVPTSGTPDYAASAPLTSSDALPKLNGSKWYGEVYIRDTSATRVDMSAVISVPDSGGTDESVLFAFWAGGGSTYLWELRLIPTGGDLNLAAWSVVGGVGTQVLDTNWDWNINGFAGKIGFTVDQNGANVDWRIYTVEPTATSYAYLEAVGTLNSHTVGYPVQARVNTDAGNADIVLGHIAIRTNFITHLDNIDAITGHNGEGVTGTAGATPGRLRRLAAENAMPMTQFSGQVSNTNDFELLGPQETGSLVDLLRDAGKVDHGILYDGLTPGLCYTTRRRRENPTAILTLDAASGDVAAPFDPADDDQGNRNKSTVTRKGGSSATFEDTDGPMGTGVIDTYDESTTLSLWADGATTHHASWYVHEGTATAGNYRYPSLTLDLAKNPDLIRAWLGAIPGSRVDVANVADIRTQHVDATIPLIVQGWTERIDQFRWDVEINCAPADAWLLVQLAEDTGDTSDFLLHLNTDGSTLVDGVAAGATSISVATPSGPLWSTTADDCPFYISLAGVKVRVTAVTGASSPQTFTVDAVPQVFPGGVPVQVWSVTALAL